MGKENDGGCAFPHVIRGDNDSGVAGMTLRDYFAAKTLGGLMADPKVTGSAEDCAVVAYEMADAMLAAREK